jgi:hypothetical protein
MTRSGRQRNADWSTQPSGVHYVDISRCRAMDKITRMDSAKTMLYFLSNAQTWRGETARRVKKELNQTLKEV